MSNIHSKQATSNCLGFARASSAYPHLTSPHPNALALLRLKKSMHKVATLILTSSNLKGHFRGHPRRVFGVLWRGHFYDFCPKRHPSPLNDQKALLGHTGGPFQRARWPSHYRHDCHVLHYALRESSGYRPREERRYKRRTVCTVEVEGLSRDVIPEIHTRFNPTSHM